VRLPESLRKDLKTPFGTLIPEKQVTQKNIEIKILNSFIITVGDATTEKLLTFGFTPHIQIVDGREKRSARGSLPTSSINTSLSCNNPAGEITEESIIVIKKAFKSKCPVRIIVNGEEDLLVIPVCIFAPKNSVVLYGQPNEGLVIVSINTEIRRKTQNILESMN